LYPPFFVNSRSQSLSPSGICYVSDLVDGLMRLMQTPDEVTGAVNLGNPVEFTIRQLAETVISLTGSSSKIAYQPAARG
jgi:UDP-glucuronate decarboxylase